MDIKTSETWQHSITISEKNPERGIRDGSKRGKEREREEKPNSASLPITSVY